MSLALDTLASAAADKVLRAAVMVIEGRLGRAGLVAAKADADAITAICRRNIRDGMEQALADTRVALGMNDTLAEVTFGSFCVVWGTRAAIEWVESRKGGA